MSKSIEYSFDSNGVRYQLVKASEVSNFNWLFFPGGPGCDSSYLHSLTDILSIEGKVWCIDLPGNGSNLQSDTMNYDCDNWFSIYLDVIRKFENPIIVGHSFGAMFPLLFPELESILTGLVLLNSAPSLWLEEAVSYAKNFDLPDLSKEMKEFSQEPNQSSFTAALDACFPYYFPKETLGKGRSLFKDLPFLFEPAVWWQKKAQDIQYNAKWIPESVPTLIIGGKYDCICPFSMFKKDHRFKRRNISLIFCEHAGHFGWIESPDVYQKGFLKLSSMLN